MSNRKLFTKAIDGSKNIRFNDYWRIIMKDYHINIFKSDENDGYIADIPDLDACSAFGSTPEEALREVQIAKQAWLDSARSEGKAVPKPKYKPAIYQTPA